MRGSSGKHQRPLLLAAVLCAAFCVAGSALGADRTDQSFGTDGIAKIPLPPEAHEGDTLPGIFDLANAPGGKIVAAVGDFSGRFYFAAARFDANGTLDTSFGTEGFTKRVLRPRPFESKAQAQAIAVQKDGRILVAGYREDEGNDLAPLLARYLPNGSPDPSFGSDGIVAPKPAAEGGPSGIGGAGSVLHDVAIEPSGRIIAVGTQDERHGPRQAALVIAYTPNGRVDRRFGHHGRVLFRVKPRSFESTALHSVKILRDGKILVAGYLRGRLFLARLTKAGRLDRRFGGGDGKVSLKINRERHGQFCCQQFAALAVQRNGRVLFAGEYVTESQETPLHLALARFKASGAVDPSFGRKGAVAPDSARRLLGASGVAIQPGGKIVVVGVANSSPAHPSGNGFSALRFLPNGRPDPEFGHDGLARLAAGGEENAAIAALTDARGRVVVGGALAQGTKKARETELVLARFLAGARK